MARYAYDVNTTQRYIDVHKQFQGGLKTVDTDDSLGAVFLRDAENVSLSEFGFIEKRYGTYEKFKAGLPIEASSNLQGYWEFLNKYIIVALDGKIYYQLLSSPTQSFSTFTQFNTVETLEYPSNLAGYLGLESDFSVGSGFNGFQNDRKMGAVNLADILYIFTGKYPIYIVEEEVDEVLTLKAYLFAKDEPTYPEIVVTGHNLMENDYDTLYYNSKDSVPFPSILPNDSVVEIQTTVNNIFPKLPYAKNGTLDFEISYDVKSDVLIPFSFESIEQEGQLVITQQEKLRELVLENVQYRPSGAGATEFSFTTIDSSTYTATSLNNIDESLEYNVNIDDVNAFSEQGFFEVPLSDTNNLATIGTEVVQTLPVYYWQHDRENFYNQSQSIFTNVKFNTIKLVRSEEEDFLNIKYKDIEIPIHEGSGFLSENEIVPGARLGFQIKDPNGNIVNFEDGISKTKSILSKYLGNDPRNSRIFTNITKAPVPNLGTQVLYNVYYQAIENETLADTGGLTIPGVNTSNPLNSAVLIYSYSAFVPQSTDLGSGVGFASISVEFTGTSRDFMEVTTTYIDGTPLQSHIIKDKDNNILRYSDLRRAFPLKQSERDNFNAILRKPSTRLELYRHDNNTPNHLEETLIKTFTLGVDLEHRNGRYYFTIPDDVDTDDHYRLVFKTSEMGYQRTETTKETEYLDQENESPRFVDVTAPSPTLTLYEDAKLYPPLFGFIFSGPEQSLYSFQPLDEYNFTLFPIVNIGTDLQPEGQLGKDLIYISLKQGLISGNYDFRFNFALKTDLLDNNLQKDSQSVYRFSHIVKDITITEEKLTDYTFFQDKRAHPIWSCNQVMEHFNKLLVYGSTQMPNSVFYSFPDRPFYFPDKFYLDFTNDKNDPVISVTPYMNILVVQSEECTWGIRGNSGLITAPSPYAPFTINPNIGTIAPASVRPVRNHLFFLSRQGIVALKSLYAVDETYNIDFMDLNIRNIVPQDSEAVAIQFDNQYWLNFPNFGITLRWYIDKKAWTLDRYGSYTNDVGSKIENTGSWEDFRGVHKYQIKNGKLEFITKPSAYETDFFIYKIGVDYSLPTDLSGTIVAKFETSFLNQNYPFHPKNYKETKLDFTVQNEYNISKGFVYEMETNEDITSESTHSLDDIPVLPNHFYEIQYDFSPQYNITDGGTFSSAPSDTYDGGDFTNNEYPILGNLIFRVLNVFLDGGSFETAPTDIIDAGDFGPALENVIASYDNFNSLLPDIDETFSHLVIDNVIVRDYSDESKVYNVNNLSIEGDSVSFQLPNVVNNNEIDIIVEGNFTNYVGGAAVYDTTYEDKLVFKTWVISENQTLNFDNIESYDQAKADLDIDLNDKLGTWVFGTSDFGKKVTAVKTIKLSGKGYNSKIYMEDYSKSKWTLESLGITYKMKRARSR